MTAHTTGPWEVATERLHPGETPETDAHIAGTRWDERATLRETVIVGDGSEIATLFQHNGHRATPGVAEANAQLIAAAPEMYEALRAISEADTPETIDAAFMQAHAAIAKATGG